MKKKCGSSNKRSTVTATATSSNRNGYQRLYRNKQQPYGTDAATGTSNRGRYGYGRNGRYGLRTLLIRYLARKQRADQYKDRANGIAGLSHERGRQIDSILSKKTKKKDQYKDRANGVACLSLIRTIDTKTGQTELRVFRTRQVNRSFSASF